MIAPSDLSLAAHRLYDDQFEHLEPGDGTYPWAAMCAALAAPIDDLYSLLFASDVPFAPAMDPELAAEHLTPEFAESLMRWLGQFAGLTLAESLGLLQQRVTLQESTAAKRGTRGALEGAARQFLIGPDGTPQTATVYITERIGGSPYVLAIATIDSETPDPEAVERALEAAMPAGRDWTYTVIAGGTYAVLFATHVDYAEVDTDFATYADVRADPSVT